MKSCRGDRKKNVFQYYNDTLNILWIKEKKRKKNNTIDLIGFSYDPEYLWRGNLFNNFQEENIREGILICLL